MNVRRECVVLHSGGLDSTVLLWEAVKLFGAGAVMSVGFDYGQRHRRELEAAAQTAELAGVERLVVDLRFLGALGGSSLTDPEHAVPDGHYADMTMKQTVVPNRNMLMLAAAGSVAVSRGASVVAYAAHAGDHTIYPDCRPEFAEAMTQAFVSCAWDPPTLSAPFIALTKADIAKMGADYGVPLALTWSCYKGGDVHCGTCGTCVERREAFVVSGVPDPTVYREMP